ncbi:hypothetical protein [Parasitella parasitica]|uniref:Uncharacterized protein n=1 Tax=Parasitella parasitica TaxID=35722 RepID=A0A0B7N864_9FUNG|nr:hypothetical protein [Parasitella parasitica]
MTNENEYIAYSILEKALEISDKSSLKEILLKKRRIIIQAYIYILLCDKAEGMEYFEISKEAIWAMIYAVWDDCKEVTKCYDFIMEFLELTDEEEHVKTFIFSKREVSRIFSVDE